MREKGGSVGCKYTPYNKHWQQQWCMYHFIIFQIWWGFVERGGEDGASTKSL